VSVSEPWAARLQECYPDKSVFTITNGFDADDFRPRPQALTPKFTITYTATLPNQLLDGFKQRRWVPFSFIESPRYR